MNRKITLLMVALVAAVIPAVAVADVMITGHISLESNLYHHPAFEFTAGPNYNAANASDSIGWTSQQGELMGLLDLQGNTCMTYISLNVLNLTFSMSNPSVPASFMGLYLNVSSSSFPAGTGMVISTYQINLTNLQALSLTHYSAGDAPISIDASSLTTAVAVDLSENPHMLITGFQPLQTLYISYVLPPNHYAGSTALMTGQFVAYA